MPERAEFWKEFICSKCQFPAPEKLRAQFENAELSEFCDCGCNSFEVKVTSGYPLEPIATKNNDVLVFEANFLINNEDKTIEIMLFVNEEGNLEYVEIDCCANSFPVPEVITIKESPYHLYISKSLIP
ncbi:MAG: hypothetical protein AB8D52_10100 [Gammaproteobacteria bacterium]